jgi:hypothetical protein
MGLSSPRRHGCCRVAMRAMADPGSPPREIAGRLGITTSTLYTYVNGDGSLKESGQRLLAGPSQRAHSATKDTLR